MDNATNETAGPLEFVEEPTAAPITPPLAQSLATSGSAALKRSYFEDDVVNDDVYTTTVLMGDVKFYAREFTRDELKAFRNAAKSTAVAMGVAEHLVYDADAFNAALAALPMDDEGNGGVEQYSARMADSFNAVLVEHLKGWDFPFPCTAERKLKLWPSNKYEFCMNLAQLGGLSSREQRELKNS